MSFERKPGIAESRITPCTDKAGWLASSGAFVEQPGRPWQAGLPIPCVNQFQPRFARSPQPVEENAGNRLAATAAALRPATVRQMVCAPLLNAHRLARPRHTLGRHVCPLS